MTEVIGRPVPASHDTPPRATRGLPIVLTLFTALAALTAPLPRAQAASATSARLLLPVTSARPGDQVLAGIELSMKPGWHTYWRNGGDSGAPTRVDWTLPPGLTAGDLQWPPPERHQDSGFVTYVYHHKVVLLVPLQIAADATPGPRDLAATVRWLECEKLCVPGQAEVRARLSIGDASEPSPDAALLQTARERLAPALPEGAADAAWDDPPSAEERTLVLRWRTPSPPPGAAHDFFPAPGESFEIAAATEAPPPAGGVTVLRKKVRKFDAAWPTRAEGVFVVLNAKGVPTQAWNASLPIASETAAAGTRGAPPPAAAAPPPSPTSPAGGVESASPTPTAATTPPAPPALEVRLSLPKALLLAVLGGLILNIMPCVLPVIALKILAFVRQSGSRPAEVRKLGMIYGLGVWFSFLVLAGLVIGVKKTAGVAGWGMQFGSPVFLIAMTTLVLLVALSLFGVFEINLTGRALDKAGDLTHREGAAGAFFNGMLATVLATPCTAPFLAPALGYAFSETSTTIVLIFSAVAFGLASPYLLLSWHPAWLAYLPKPGPWMERFKTAMGFPMLAAAVWLYSVAATRHFPGNGALWLGLFLLGIALAAWVWGEFVQRGRQRQTLAMALAVLLAATAYGVALEGELQWRAPRSPTAATAATRAGGTEGFATPPVLQDRIQWQPWSRDQLAAARRLDRPVFVDFTADWCLTCKRNERAAINIPEVRQKLLETQAIPLLGDHTLYPPDIAEELQRFGRAGVPLVLVYPRDPARPPEVLPEWLTPEIVLSALDRAAAPPRPPGDGHASVTR